MESSEISMERMCSLLLLGLLTGLIGYPAPATGGPSASSASPNWPPRTALDLVLLLQGTDPSCLSSGQTSSITLKSLRQLIGFVPQLITSESPTDWLYGALKILLNANNTQGDLKHLLLWGMSQNLSWGFLDLPLVTPDSVKSQFLGPFMKSDLPTFLKICSDHLFPALKNVCSFMYGSISGSLQSMCLVLTSPQSSQMDTQFCTMFFSSLSELLSGQCNTKTVRTVRSVTVNCAYATWYNSSVASPSDVSTCSENDREQFILSVCADQMLLNQLASQPANNWLSGYCVFSTNPENICNYVSWEGKKVSVFSVAYCWLHDQDQFTSFLCTNPNVLGQLKENVDNQWLDPVCPTVPPTNIISTNLIQELCNYEQWSLQIVNPSTVALCEEIDRIGFTQYVCSSLEVLQKLLIVESNSWVAIFCSNVIPDPLECNYAMWYKNDTGAQLKLVVDPVIVVHCSQVNENQFIFYVCNNPSLLLTLSGDANDSWVLQFCISRVCNYTTWNSSSPESSTVDLCWLIDREQLNSYLCSHKNILQNIELNSISDISCPVNSSNRTVCNYNLWTLTDLIPSILGYCAVQDMANFQTYICGNSSLITILKNNSETSWVSIFCNAQNNGNIHNCTDSLLNFYLQSCPKCNRTELEKISLSVCSDQNLVRVLALFWNSSALINKFILWNMCDYFSWEMMPPPSFLVWYCWKCDSITFSDFLCNNFQLYDELVTETRIRETPICDPNKTCQYSTWDLTALQISLIKYCALWDAQGLTQYICRNSTIVKLLLENTNLSWVELSCFGSISPSNTSNLCNYGEWISDTESWMGPVDFSTVFSCSKNDTMSFMMNVCNNSQILSAISKGPALTWTLNICYKLSPSNVLTQILVWDVCDYSQTMTFTPLMVEFCSLYDEENFFNYLCSNLTFYAVIKAQPQNFWLKPICAPLAPTTATGALNYSIVQCHNQYSNLTSLDISLIQFCVEYDQEMFLNTFCNATLFQQENQGCSWGTKLCSYDRWHGVYVHAVVVKACWASDQLNFMADVCSDPSLLDELYSANSWVRPVCRSQKSGNQFESLVKAVCRYKEWGSLSSVPGSIAAFCNAYNHETYMHSICDSQQEAVCNDTIERWWEPSYDCNYTNWEMGFIDLDETLMCWIFEKENFTTHVCTQSNVLSKLSNDSKTSWVAHICPINPSLFNETDICLSENDKKQLQWNCSTDLSIVCPRNGLTVASFLPISICYLQNVGLNLTTPSITTLYTQAVDTTIILLLLLQDMQILSLSDITGVQAWALRTVLNIISQNALQQNQKTELLQTFANTLFLLIEEQSPPHSWTIIETLFNLTVSELKVCISSLQPKSAKHFLSVLLQNQTSIQVSDDYFSMIVSTLLSVQVPSEPLLFCDVVPFLRYLEPDELIRFLPPLQDNTQVLGILSRYALSLSNDKRHVLGFWLRRSTLFENLTKTDGIFLQQVGNLLPLFSLDVFVQLSAQQVVSILPSLPGDLPAPYQRVVASKVLQAPNITVQDVELMGRSVCQADVQDLKPYGRNMNISLALRRNLFQCVTRGDLFPESMMLDFLFGDLRSQDLGQLNSKSFPSLSEAICSLGQNFTQGLRPEQLLPVLSDVASVTLTAAQAREIVQKVLNPGNVSDKVLSHMGSLVLGISPTLLQQLSDNQLSKLLPALTSNADMLSSTQTLAVFRTLWTSWNVSEKLNELGTLLPSLPLILLRTRIKEILSHPSNLTPLAGVKWNKQQALLLIREVTQMMHISNQVRSSANSLTSTNCDFLRSLLQNNTIQAMEQFREIIISLPQHVVRCALDKVIILPPSLKLLKSLSSQMIAEIQPSIVAVLPVNSCRYVLHILTSEPESVASLPQQRRYGLLDALIRCLNSAGTTSHQAQFIVLGVLAPFLKGSAYLTLTQGMMLLNVERVTNYCYPQETWLPLSQLLQEAQSFGSPNRWTSQLLERLDRLVPLLPLASLQSLNKTALSIRWLSYVLSGERRWRKSALGTACRKSQTVDQQAVDMQKQRTLLQRLFLTRSLSKSSVFAPECSMIRDSIVSAWGVEVLLRMTPANFMDCLEEIGQDADIPNSELASLLARVLEIAGPVSTLPNYVLMRLGRLATKLNVQQLKMDSLRDSQIMEAFGKQQEWTMSQLNALASGFMQTQNVTAKDLNALHLVTLGHVICGLNERDLAQIKPLEFCTAVIYLGHLSLRCTEQQFETLARLCTSNDIFGPVSGWTEDVFLEIGSIAAGLQDMELSALVLEQIQGLTPLAISLIHPQKFAVSFSPLQLQLFSWSQAKAVTEQQTKLLDNEQIKALTLAFAEDSGNQTYRAGKSHAADFSYCTLLHLSTLLPVLHVLYIVNPTVVFRHVN